jgi:hypothetical protein
MMAHRRKIPTPPRKRAAPNKTAPRNHRVPRTRNAGTMTGPMFWNYVRGLLRGGFRWWKPVALCKLAARRKYTGKQRILSSSGKLQEFEFHCAACHGWFPEKQVQVDHIVDCGSINCAADTGSFIERMFCEVEGLQVLCMTCHRIKTNSSKNTT